MNNKDNKIEIRSIIDDITLSSDENNEIAYIVKGKAIVFDTPTVIYTDNYGYEYREIVDAKALNNIKLDDVPLLYNHDESKAAVLARQRDKCLTLDLRVDGLYFEAELKSNLGKDVYTGIKAGDITGCSFGFICNTDSITIDDNAQTRTILDISYLSDISIVDNPAYTQTNVEARNKYEAASQKRKEIELRKRLMLLTY